MKSRKYNVCLWLAVVGVVLGASSSGLAQLSRWDSLALTPPMGWNSWNRYHCDINEEIVRATADAMVEKGMRDAGYLYVVIDDCWQIARDEQGNIIPDPERFPSGMKALGDYIHSKGLKFGIYSDAGTKTCQKRPGSRGYEFQDARTYASWGVDYLKYDWCHTSTQDAPASYALMRQALDATGRPIVFSICEWGTHKPWLWGAKVGGNLWRTTEDILNCWDCTTDWGGMGFIWILDKQDTLWKYAGPGHWNDPDMLEVGNSGLTLEESRAHFSLWCVLTARLMAGNDIIHMPHGVGVGRRAERSGPTGGALSPVEVRRNWTDQCRSSSCGTVIASSSP